MSMPVTDVTALLLTDVVGSTTLWQLHPVQMNAVTLLDDLDLG